MFKTMRLISPNSASALACGASIFLSLASICQAETLKITSADRNSTKASSSKESELIQTIIRTSQEFKPVSQFRDVQPTDWAYMAIQSITQKYGCISGFPDNTFRGQEAITRFQFASGLNVCLDKISVLLTNGFADKVNKSDLNDLNKLQDDFAPELVVIKGRVDALEAKTATLEAQQFSTTTKLYGQAILGIQGRVGSTSRFGANPVIDAGDPATNITFGQQVQLSLVTQFPDRSILLTGLQVGNLSTDAPFTSFFALNNSFTRLGYEGNTGNTLTLSDLTYRFLASDKLAIVVGAKGISAVNIFRGPNRVESAGQGPVSVFAQRNPIIGFNSGDAGIGFDWQFNKRFSLQAVYSASNANDPNTGLFGGQFSTGIQLAANPSDNLDITFYYLNSYTNNGALNSPAGDNFIGATASFPPGNESKFSTNAFGSTISWALSRKFTLGGWIGFTTSAIQNSDFSGTVETLNWMTFSNFIDLFKEGDVLGLYVGQPPKIVSSNLSGNINFPSLVSGGIGGEGGQKGTTTHIEAFYRFPLSRNITVTPGVVVILNPGNNPNSDTITIGVLRTTLTF